MAAFPEGGLTPPPQTPYGWTPTFRTLLGGPFDTPTLNALILWNFPVMSVSLTFAKRLNPSDYQQLYDFFISCKGMAVPFTFFDFNGWKGCASTQQWGLFTPIFIAKRNGSTTVYDLPALNMGAILVYDNGSLMTLTTDYSITPGGGTGGLVDKITFVTGGTSGHLATCTFQANMIGKQWNNVYLAVRDGTTTVYDLPGKNIHGLEVFDNLVPMTITTDYSISAGAGTDGCDQITFASGGTAGHTATLNFIGRFGGTKFHFTVDSMPFQTWYSTIIDSQKGLSLEQFF